MNDQLQRLLLHLRNDARFPGFQGISVSANGSVMLIWRHGGKKFLTFAEFLQAVGPQPSTAQAQPQP